MAAEKVSLFTTAMRSEFLDAWEATADEAPWQAYTTTIDSSARIEHYPWLSPVPAIAEYKGHRQFGEIGEVTYKVTNLEYNSAFMVKLRDVEDDQVGGYKLKPRELAEKARKFPGRLALQHLASGQTYLGFDGTAFFANSHTIGTGDNLLAGTAAASDGVTHAVAVLIHDGALKPLIYQDRKPPKLETNADSPEALMAKTLRYWIDLEGAAAFGYWWDAILIKYSNTPTLTEIQTDLGLVEDQFRGFYLPYGLASDTAERIHEQREFSTSNTTIVTSTKLANKFRQVLNQDTIVQSGAAVTNIYKGWANLVPSGFMNSVT